MTDQGDAVMVGHGESQEVAVNNHDQNPAAFLQRCADHSIRLNAEKAKLRLRDVPTRDYILIQPRSRP